MSFSAIASILIGPIAELLGKVIPDKDAANRLAFEIATLAENQAHQQIMAQIEVNKAEAENANWFVSGWRPGAGWVCVAAMANNFLIVPYAIAVGIEVPTLELGEMMPVLLGMLGLGGMRSYEKRSGVARP